MVSTLVPLRYPMIKQLSCIIEFYLGSLMRAVAMQLQMKMILFIKFYHTSDRCSFPSVSTYLQNNNLTRNVWGWELPRWPQTRPFALTERIIWHKAAWATYCHGNQVAWHFQVKDNAPTLCSLALYIFMAISTNMCGIFWSTLLFKHCIPQIHSIIFSLEWKYVIYKDPFPK